MPAMNVRRYLYSLVFGLLAAALTLGVSTVIAADLTVIELRNRTADEMLPVLRPLISPDAALSGIDYKLFIRGSATDVARVREALTILDRTPRQLIVSVRYNDNPQDRTTGVGVGGKAIHSGSTNGEKISVHAGTTISTTSGSSVSSVRVLEGNGAHISTGQSVPLVTAVRWPAANSQRPNGGSNGVAIDYHEFTSGFNVMPRVNGDRVLLDITTQQERAPTGAAPSAVQRATTTISGRLGEWLELGGVTSSSYEQNSTVGVGRGSHVVSTQSDRQTIEVKVEEAE
jgi:type II secretory pathway component GspD/PulD (secretin)